MVPKFSEPPNQSYFSEAHGKEKIKSLVNILMGYEEFILDLTGTIISTNLEAVTITGYEEWEVIGQNISLLYTEDDQKKYKYEHDLYKAQKERKYTTSDIKLKKHGHRFLAKTIFTSVLDGSGVHNGYRVTLGDASQMVEYEVTSKQQEYGHDDLYNNPFVGVFRANVTDLSIDKLNSKCLEILGLDSNISSLRDIFYLESDFGKFADMLGRNCHVTDFIFRASNSKHEVYCQLNCYIIKSGGFIEGALKDITQSLKQADEIQSVKAELNNFLYRSSHDIRSPLATILGLTNLIRSEKATGIDDILSYVDLIEDRVKNLDDILSSLKEISINNLVPLNLAKVDIGFLIEKVVKSLAPHYPLASIEYPVSNIWAESDSNRLEVIFRTVIENALKYHTSQSIPKVSIKMWQINDECIVEVLDNGVGIDDNHLLHVFEPFYRIDSQSGCGLGLFLAKGIGQKLGVGLDIASKVGQGTTVTICMNRKAENRLI